MRRRGRGGATRYRRANSRGEETGGRRDERSEGGHSRPAPVVKRNGAKRTRRTSVPAVWEEEIERREGNGPLERALAEPEGAERRGKRRRRRGDACATERVETKCTGIHVYIGGVRETPKEARERTEREARDERRERERERGTQGRREKARKGGAAGRNSDSRDARTAASLWCAKLPRDI